MKHRVFIVPVLSIFIIIASTLFTYQVFSYYHPPAIVVDDNPTYTLKFPDGEYAISKRDLDDLTGELIIPTHDLATPKISYNTLKGELESLVSPQDYVLDAQSLRAQINNYAIDQSTSFVPHYLLRDRYTTSLADFNLRLNQTYRSPLNISLKDGSIMTDITISPPFLRALIRPISTDLLYPIDINKEALISYITGKLTPKQKKYFNASVAYQNTKNALNLRFMGNETPLVLGVDDGPTSHGEKADKYLEVDLSQQKMYFFIGGTLLKNTKSQQASIIQHQWGSSIS